MNLVDLMGQNLRLVSLLSSNQQGLNTLGINRTRMRGEEAKALLTEWLQSSVEQAALAHEDDQDRKEEWARRGGTEYERTSFDPSVFEDLLERLGRIPDNANLDYIEGL